MVKSCAHAQRAIYDTRNPLTSTYAARTCLMCPSTAEPGIIDRHIPGGVPAVMSARYGAVDVRAIGTSMTGVAGGLSTGVEDFFECVERCREGVRR